MKPKCSIVTCPNVSDSKGWCKPHYDAWLRTGDPLSYKGDRSHLTLWQRIQEIGFTRTVSGCLEYNGFRNELGYGQFRLGRGKLNRVHRIAYANLVGPLTDDEKVCHACDNPPCSEPSHLFKGSQADNMKDCAAKGRNSRANWTACPKGHSYPPDRPKNVDKNRCRECANERNRRYQARKKERQLWPGNSLSA